MDKYARVISVSGRRFRVSETMGDIFLAHASDIASRGATELVPLVHEGGVDQLLVGPKSRITVSDVPVQQPLSITAPIATAEVTTAA